MLPVAIAMVGSGLDRNTILFVGWFGPRGIASVLYVIIVLTSLGFAGYEKMLSIMVLTILLSVFLHGMSAVPLTHRYVGGLSK
jgi:NhaP-type Na+/H+ or K+/H+ antiporter